MTTRRLLEAVACGRLSSEGARAMLDKMDKEKRERRKRTAPKRAGSVAKKKASREEQSQATQIIRAGVFARSEGQCEFCGASLAYGWEFHHLVSGPSRRILERSDTTAAICLPCHRAYHRTQEDVMRAAREWALRRGFRESLKEIDRRIEKVECVRGVF